MSRPRRSRLPRRTRRPAARLRRPPDPAVLRRTLDRKLGGAKIYLKREDLLHTGAHKINNALGQILLAKRLGKKRIIAETGAGQHGVATATVCARFGLECVVYMGKVDMERQALNVARMRFLGAEVRAVTAGQATLKEAVNEAMRDWVTNVRTPTTSSAPRSAPTPFPMMVRDFHRVIGSRPGARSSKRKAGCPTSWSPASAAAAMPSAVPPVPRRPGACAWSASKPAATASSRNATPRASKGGKLGVLQGTKTWLLADDDGQIELTHSVSAGLDYAAVGPEHAWLQDLGRVEYTYATDDEALAAFKELAHIEGIIPALESAHAMAYVKKIAPAAAGPALIIVNLSGRGDKDVAVAVKCPDIFAAVVEAVADPGIVPFGAAVPGDGIVPGIRIASLSNAICRRMGSAAYRYSMAPGRIELRAAVARRLLTAGVKVTPDDIVTTLGATEALALVLRAMTRPGEVVAVEIPTYFGVLHLLKDLGLKVAEGADERAGRHRPERPR
jgi:tryptophan synthase beta chain